MPSAAETAPRPPLFQPTAGDEQAGPPRLSPRIAAPLAPSEAIARALDTPRLTLGVIGRAVGVSRFALEKYRNGQRPLPETLRLRLIAYLEAHAREIQTDADALRTLAALA